YGNVGGKFPDKALSFLRPEAKPTATVPAGNAAWCQGSQTHSERYVEINGRGLAHGGRKRRLRRSLLRANRENVRDNGIAVGRLQTRAVRHAIHNPGPIVDLVVPKRRQRVALDTAVDQKRSAFAQHGDIDRAFFCCGCHLWSDRWYVIDRFASQQAGGDEEKGQYLFHT